MLLCKNHKFPKPKRQSLKDLFYCIKMSLQFNKILNSEKDQIVIYELLEADIVRHFCLKMDLNT